MTDVLLYLNYDLDIETQTYSFVLLISTGVSDPNPIMGMEAFDDIQYSPNEWFYFAIGIDFSKRELNFYMEVYDKTNPISKSKHLKLDFLLKNTQNFQFNINHTGSNSFFDNSQKLLGSLYQLTAADFVDERMIYFGMGVLSASQLTFSGMLLDLIPNVSDKDSFMHSTGKIVGEYQVKGKVNFIQNEDPSQIGVILYEAPFSFINMGAIKLTPDLQIQLGFKLLFKYEESLSDDYLLISYGEDGVPGYVEIKLTKRGAYRAITFRIIGIGDILLWESPFDLSSGIQLDVFIGFVIAPSKSFQVVYFDNMNNFQVK